ncbi:ABC-2 type transport system permease protein [Pseudobutyrivibrio sp. UC1225]|uniref:ABC transporter permease n=1 Tax=Pseudobutyrivibrio sp. UC1225 TaxID=1798185 RepID=UPI0008DFC8AC|nr:ABC transporter permease [Pseudobutyrivibrio sp. UC1225]SFN93773.1 ABC-2 type transport system permease protein [Pseudobutyrivibrio sp. UC1225]
MEYGLKQYIFVIRELTSREIKRKYSRSVLGILWSVLQPLLFMFVMTAVFSGFTLNDISYPVYYLTGYTTWSMFSIATTTAMTAFEDNKLLFQKTKLPREVFVLSRDYTSLVNLGFSSIALLLVLIFFKVQIKWTVVVFFIDVIFELIFTIGISFLLATIYVFYKDIKFIWQNIIVMLVHMIAIFYPIERYPDSVREFTAHNPLFIYPDIARKSIINGTCEVDQLMAMFMWAIGALLIGLIIFKLAENSIIKKI